jgi:uncharacterized protein YqgQ
MEKGELRKKLMITALQLLLEENMLTHEEYVMTESLIRNGR